MFSLVILLMVLYFGFATSLTVFNNIERKMPRRSFSNAVYFEQTVYITEVLEEQAAGLEVLLVSAHSLDKLPLLYSMISVKDGRSANMFKLDRQSGLIRTQVPLDRETIDVHKFRVTVYESGNHFNIATADVTIVVKDLNDERPIFEKSVYVSSISESVEIGTTVTHVHASDKDSEENGDIVYSIIDGVNNPEFGLDSKTGVLTIKHPIDRERKSFYRLMIKAQDRGRIPLSSQALVEITVEDVNDNYPVFNSTRYNVNVSEDLDPQSKPTITKLTAFDPDTGDNGVVHYSFVNGNVNGRFTIDYITGEVKLVGALSYKEMSVYELVIRAQDRGLVALSTTCLLSVFVIDVNNFAPKFYVSHYEETVSEDVPTGFAVAKVEAYDEDSGRNGQIRYRIADTVSSAYGGSNKNEKNNKFPLGIDPVSGWITVSGVLDRETQNVYQFHVVAQDMGEPKELSSSVRVTVNVKDVDDMAPEFEQKFYNVSISESVIKGHQVCVVRAVDRDEISKVEYTVLGGNDDGKFILISKGDSSIVTVNDRLSYRQQSQYTLNIKAVDTSGKSDIATVYIHILDQNSEPYWPSDQPFLFSILENSPVGYAVAVFKALDNDDGENALLYYKLKGSTDFTIDNSTGLITVAAPLDREKRPTYSLEIIATDHGKPPLSGSTVIELVLTDVNDNSPVFSQPNYSVSVSEDVLLGTSILQISATDLDAGSNGRVFYSTIESSGASERTFYIDPTNGVVRIEQKLDRELQSSYNITVLAADKGSPSRISSTFLFVKVLDVNDNAPEWRTERDRFNCYVKENRPIGSTACHITAIDPDEGVNAVIVYKILGGRDMAAFELVTTDSGLDIITRTELDYESGKTAYSVQVQASSGELSSVAEVFIHIVDVNDHRPVLKDFFILFNNFRDYFLLYNLGRIPAWDPDVNDTLTYSLHGNEAGLLNLNAETGEITISSNLNTNRQIQAQMRACATDGVNMECAKCSLHVQMVTDAMLLNSVTLRIRDATPESFLTTVSYSRFVDTVASIVPTRRQEVALFSVKQDTEVVGLLVLNVSFSIRKQRQTDQWLSAETLKELLFLHRKALAEIAGLEILPFDDNLCVREPCMNFERCQTVLKFGNASSFINTDDFIMRPIDPINTFTCYCPRGYAGMSKTYLCDTEVNLCYSSPCNNGTCIQKENGYTCLCPPTHTGLYCELPLDNGVCVPSICKGASQCESKDGAVSCKNCRHPTEFTNKFCELRARSFQNGAFLTLSRIKARNRFHIELSFATKDANGLLFYNGRYHPEHDFVSLELINGKLNLSLSLGGTATVSAVLNQKQSLFDGLWHKANIRYFNRTVILSVDDCDEELALRFSEKINYPKCTVSVEVVLEERCLDVTVPCQRFLDLAGPFYLGGLPNSSLTYPTLTRSFNGCIKDLFVDRRLIDLDQYIANRGSVPGCANLTNVCHSNPCGHAKQCNVVWDGYVCTCPKGSCGQNCSSSCSQSALLRSKSDGCRPNFAGSPCVDVCHLNPCQNGSCYHTPTGYSCRCKLNFSGKHCETRTAAAVGTCPKSWWGYPLCGPCSCKVSSGFDTNCNQKTGVCTCKSLHYRPLDSDVCLPCDCYYPFGAKSLSCHPVSGQCVCRGNVVGRRCDGCIDQFAQINASSGYCEAVYDGCPEKHTDGILWSKTAIDLTAYERCAIGSKGIATRRCSKDSLWDTPNLFNCTSNRFRELESWMIKLDAGLEFTQYLALKIALDLANHTSKDAGFLYGRDVYISYRLLMAVLRYELSQAGLALTHVKDQAFVEAVTKAASSILSMEYRHWWNQIMRTGDDNVLESYVGSNFLETLCSYGKHLARLYFNTYMESFQVVTENIVFSVDALDVLSFSQVLPKYNNFMPVVGYKAPASLQIYSSEDSGQPAVAFYAIFRSLGDLMPSFRQDNIRFSYRGYALTTASPLFSFSLYDISGRQVNSISSPFLVGFQLDQLARRSPQCAFWNERASVWSASGCSLIDYNDTYAICSCHHPSTLAILMEEGHSHTRFVMHNNILHYLTIVNTSVCILLLTTAIITSIFNKQLSCFIQRALARSIMICLLVSIAAYSMVIKAAENKYCCKAVAICLHFCYLSLFTWLLLSLAHIYRIITDLRDINSVSTWSYHIIGWGFPASVAALCFALNPDSYGDSLFCWFSLYDSYIWTMNGLIAIILLVIVYVSGMCLFLVCSNALEFVAMNMRSSVVGSIAVTILAFCNWLLALLSLNMQHLWLHYSYLVVCLLLSLTAVFVYCRLYKADAVKWIKLPIDSHQNDNTDLKKLPPNLHDVGEAVVAGLVACGQNIKPEENGYPESTTGDDSSAFHEHSFDQDKDGSTYAVANRSEAAVQQLLLPSQHNLNVGFLAVDTSDSCSEANDEVSAWLRSNNVEDPRLVPLSAFKNSGAFADCMKPDLIPSPDQYCNFVHSSRNFNTLPANNYRSIFIRPYHQQMHATNQTLSASNSLCASPRSSFSTNSASFTTFRRPILSPASEKLKPSSHCSSDCVEKILENLETPTFIGGRSATSSCEPSLLSSNCEYATLQNRRIVQVPEKAYFSKAFHESPTLSRRSNNH